MIEPLKQKFKAKFIDIVIPINDTLKGDVGFYIFGRRDSGNDEEFVNDGVPPVGEIEEVSERFSFNIFKEAKIINIDDVDEFDKIYDDLLKKDYYLDLYDNPDNFEMGIVVRKRSGSVCYLASYDLLYNSKHKENLKSHDQFYGEANGSKK